MQEYVEVSEQVPIMSSKHAVFMDLMACLQLHVGVLFYLGHAWRIEAVLFSPTFLNMTVEGIAGKRSATTDMRVLVPPSPQCFPPSRDSAGIKALLRLY